MTTDGAEASTVTAMLCPGASMSRWINMPTIPADRTIWEPANRRASGVCGPPIGHAKATSQSLPSVCDRNAT